MKYFNEPMPKSKNEEDDRVTHNVPTGGIDEPTDRSTDKSEDRSNDQSTHRSSDVSMLRQRLDVMVEDIDVSAGRPSLDARVNSHCSSAADETLRALANVLSTRYEGKQFSKSLVVDYALRVILRDVVENAEESQLVQWLDRALEY